MTLAVEVSQGVASDQDGWPGRHHLCQVNVLTVGSVKGPTWGSVECIQE